jgi:hypothetical protein
MKWLANEGAGVGVNQRLIRFLGRTWPRLAITQGPVTTGLINQFLTSAKTLVDRLGPPWTQRKIGNQPFGVCILMILWLVLPMAIVFTALHHP